MTDRRTALADAALRVVAREGLRGLTHRAVDAQAGLPAGSTSNVFRTREALVQGVGDHLVALDIAAWGGRPLRRPVSVDDLAAALAATVVESCRADPDAVRARFAVFTAAPHAFADHHAQLRTELAGLLASLGVTDPERRAISLTDLIDGALLHAVTVRAGQPLDTAHLAAAIRALASPTS